MNELFLKIINMSISASWLVLAVLILRLVLKKAPKWVNVLLWGIVAIRLICPFSFESALSLIPSAETIPMNIGIDTTPTINSGINAINNAVNPIISQSNTPMAGASANPLQITIGIYEYIWIFGMIALALYTAISYWHLRHKVDTAVRYKDNIFQSENVNSPFVLGIIKPKIYLPFKMDGQNMEHVIAHEQAHIRRKDHWWKPLGFLLLTIHWFNPLMWLAYILLCRDIELACDEKVIKELGNEQRADYTQALVACSVNRRMIAACPLAFGEVGVKERVKSVMNYKKPAFWIVVLAVIACVGVAVCFLTNPKNYSQEIQVNGQIYLRQENEVETLPTGSYELGELRSILHSTKEHPSEDFSATNLDEKYAGNMLYQSSTNASTIYLEDLSGFYIPFTVDESTPDKVTFEAEVLEIYEGYFLVAPEESWALNSADRIEVPMVNMDPALEPQVGDTIKIVYSGEILETYPARIADVYGIQVVEEADKFYLTIGAEGVKSIELSMPHSSGGVESADGSLLKKGERIWLEILDGYNDLRGLTITALGKDGEVIWTASVPNNDENKGFTHLTQDGWTISNLPSENVALSRPSLDTEPYSAKGVSGINVKELSRVSGEFECQDGVSFVNLAPGEEVVSASAIHFEENSSVMLFITWGAQDLFLEFGIRAADGAEFYQEKQGGSSVLLIENIPAGTYHLYVKNSDAYDGIPAYENPDAFDGVSFNATGAMNYIINPD